MKAQSNSLLILMIIFLTPAFIHIILNATIDLKTADVEPEDTTRPAVNLTQRSLPMCKEKINYIFYCIYCLYLEKYTQWAKIVQPPG